MILNKEALKPNYKAVANAINLAHGSNYEHKHMRFIHAGKQPMTESIIEEIDLLVGEHSAWHSGEGTARVSREFCEPDYEAISCIINAADGTSHRAGDVRRSHMGHRSKKLQQRIESLIGLYSDWFDTEGEV